MEFFYDYIAKCLLGTKISFSQLQPTNQEAFQLLNLNIYVDMFCVKNYFQVNMLLPRFDQKQCREVSFLKIQLYKSLLKDIYSR